MWDQRSGKVVQFKALLMTVRHFGLAALCGGCIRAGVVHRSLQKRFSGWSMSQSMVVALADRSATRR